MSSITPKQAPELSIPPSDASVTLRIIDPKATIKIDSNIFCEPPIAGFTDLNCPAYSFLISNTTGSKPRHILFDLGVRPDMHNFAPALYEWVKTLNLTVDGAQNVAQILDKAPTAGQTTPSSREIEAVVWSHHHFDHTGDPSLFPPETALVVGPGFKEAFLPAYPEDKEGRMNSADWAGRELREVAFDANLTIGGFKALDYFGDGSFYLLDTPGHAVGHVCGLARVTTSPASFVFMGGDAAHHAGELRPTEYLPLPDSITLPRSTAYRTQACPGEVLLEALERSRTEAGARQRGSRTQPWFEPTAGSSLDKGDAMATIATMFTFDAHANIFMVMAHDSALRDVLPLFPATANDWAARQLDETSRWKFVDDFAAILEG